MSGNQDLKPITPHRFGKLHTDFMALFRRYLTRFEALIGVISDVSSRLAEVFLRGKHGFEWVTIAIDRGCEVSFFSVRCGLVLIFGVVKCLGKVGIRLVGVRRIVDNTT